MKKWIFLLIIILSGCNSGSSSDESTVSKESRNISINLYPKEIQEKTDYTHFLTTCGYTLTINDDNGSREVDDICITNSDISFKAVGDVNLKVDYKISKFDTIKHSYTVEGEGFISKDESFKTIILENKKWSFVTFDYNSIIDKAEMYSSIDDYTLNVEMKNKDNLYYYAYITNNSTVLIYLSNGSTIDLDIIPEPNKHYALFINSDDLEQDNTIDFIINSAWEDPTNVDVTHQNQKDIYLNEEWINIPSSEYTLNDYNFIGKSSNTTPKLNIPNDNYSIGDLDFSSARQIIGNGWIRFFSAINGENVLVAMNVESNGITKVTLHHGGDYIIINIKDLINNYSSSLLTSDITYTLSSSASYSSFHVISLNLLPN